MPEFTTRTLASDVTDLEQEYPYIYWMPDFQCLAISKNEITYEHLKSSNGIIISNLSDDAFKETTTFDYYYLQIPSYSTGDAYRLFYNEITGWEAELPDILERSLTSSGTYYSVFGRESSFTYYSNIAGNLPSTIPDFENLDEMINTAINNAINSTTSTTSQAVSIQKNINNQVQRYENGEITGNQLQVILDDYSDTLTVLANSESNTLVDQMAINNAQNTIQIAQDKLNHQNQINNDNAISQDLIDKINSLFNISSEDIISITDLNGMMRLYLYYYNWGLYTKEQLIIEGIEDEGLPGLQTLYNELDGILSVAKTQSDLQLVNSITQVISQTMDNINSAGDVNKDIAHSAQQSDVAEKQYLDSLTSETTASIQDLSPKKSFTENELGTAQEVLGIIWNNSLVKRLLVICGCFMVVCVVLGIRYKV